MSDQYSHSLGFYGKDGPNRRKKTRSLRRVQRNEARRKRFEVMMLYGQMCWYCAREFAGTIDHMIPLSKGGNSDIANLRPACFRCNSAKADKFPWELNIA